MNKEKQIIAAIDEREESLTQLSQQIWEYAEVGLQEHKSAEAQMHYLKEAGFEVSEDVAGMPTAFVASYGSGEPVVAFLGEFDALPGTSQEPVPYEKELSEDAPGHSCGHNLLGVASLAGAVAAAEVLKESDAEGTVRYYGCPAEETLVGKVYMVKDGLFDDVDAALCWHPSSMNVVRMGSSSAMNSVKFTFYGESSHAAGAPEMGRSALDAVELMNVGANYLREHVIEEARIHYVITDGGGEPNVVPPEAEVWYYVRAPERDEVEEIYQRLLKVAEGAALMTETEMEINFLSGCYNKLVNRPIADVLWEKMQMVGPPEFSEQDREFAHKMTEHFSEGQRRRTIKRVKERYDEDLSESYLHEDLLPPKEPEGRSGGGSTDVADVSWVTPTAEFSAACNVLGARGHSWQVTASTGMEIGHKGMLSAAKILALTGWELLTDEELLQQAKEDFHQDTKDNPYESPIPDGCEPPLDQLPSH